MNKFYLPNLKKCRIIILLICIFFSVFPSLILQAQTSVPFTTAGATTWFCPAGVTSITVECWGGGGAGGGATSNPSAGGGGAGGAYTKATSVSVVPGTTYDLFVGAGGVGATAAVHSGGSSWFNTNTTLLAVGGTGGNIGTNGAGATAPTSGNIGGTSNFYGGNGGTGTGTAGSRGGGGGGSAGSANHGNNGSGVTGGAAVTNGGAGANGSTSTGDGADATTLGGGGAGAHAGSSTDRSGGNGFAGKVLISYTTPGTYKSLFTGMSVGSTTWCAGETRTVTVTVKNNGTAAWLDIAGKQDINIGVKWDGDPDYLVRTNALNLAAGATGTYSFTVTAPTTTGINHLTFDVVYEAVSWFGNNNSGVGPGNVVSQSAALAISALPTAVTVNGAGTFCGNTTITAANGGNGTMYFQGTTSGGTSTATPASSAAITSSGTYYFRARSAGGCWGTEGSATVTINPLPATVIASGAGTFCSTTTITASNGGSGTINFQGTTSNGTSTLSPSALQLISASGTYYFRAQSATGCWGTQGSVIVTENTPQGSLTSGGAVCNGSSGTIKFTSTNGGTGPFTVIYSDGTSNFTTLNYTSGSNITVTPVTTTTYTLVSVANASCTRTTGFIDPTASISLNGRPTGIISGTQSVCNGQSATLTLSVAGSGTLSGTLSDGTTFSGTAPTITKSVSAGSTVTYTIATLTNGTCNAIAADKTGTAIVTVNARPTGAISGTQSICSGQSATLTLSVVGSGTISGTLSDGSTFSGTAPTITKSVSPASLTTYTIATLSDANCTAVAGDKTGSAIVTVNPTPVTTGVTICQGGSGSLMSSSACSSGTVITAGPNYATAGATITGIGNTAWTGSGNITSNNNSYASVYLADETKVSNYLKGTQLAFAIPAEATIQGIQVTIGRYSSNFLGLFVRTQDNVLRLVNNGVIVGTNKAATGTDWPNSESAATYGGSTDLWGTTWTPNDINNPNFGLVLSVLNNTGFGIDYTAYVDYAQITVTYAMPGTLNWYTVSSGGTSIGSGTPFNPVAVAGSGLANTSTAGTTTFYAECSTVPGCRTPANFVINSLPAVSFSGLAASYCANNGIVTLTGNHAPSGSFSGPGIIDNGNGTAGFNPATAGAGGPYAITYSYTDGNSCPNSSSQNVTVNAPPAITIQPVSPAAICSGSGTQTISVTATGAALTYSWRKNGIPVVDDAVITGQGNAELILTNPTTAVNAGSYDVVISGSCSPSAISNPVTVAINLPATISAGSNQIICSGSTATMAGEFGGSASSAIWTTNGTGTFNNNSTSAVYTPGSADIIAGSVIVTYTSNDPGLCGPVNSSITLTILPETWTGVSSADWNDGANWSCGALPNAFSNVTIPSGTPHDPIVSTATAMIHNISIASGASLTVAGQNFQIGGSINNSGTFDVSNGTVEFNGTSAQAIPANAFASNIIRALIISNDVSLDGLDSLTGTLSFGSSNKTLTTNGNLILKSTISGTASVGQIINGNSISGDVTVERYIATGVGAAPNHGKSWQLLAIPTSGQTIKQAWQEGATTPNGNPHPGYGTMLTSDVANAAAQTTPGFDVYTSTGPSIKVYNYLTNGYNSPAGTQLPIYNKKGYFVFVRGDRGVISAFAPATPTVLRTKGMLFTPANPPPVDTVIAGKFESIGNPYASAIDMRNITKTGGVDEFFQVWDPKLGGGTSYGAYQTFFKSGSDYIVVPGGGSYGAFGTANNYIQSGQAFMVQATGTNGTVSFTENAKANDNRLFSRPVSTPQLQNLLQTALYGVKADGSTTLIDGVLNSFDDSYSNAIDALDAKKSLNTGENLSIKTGVQLLVIERKHTILQQDTIFLNLAGMKVQSYQFQFNADRINAGAEGFVEDNYLLTRTPLNLNGSTIVNFTITNVPDSYASDRFRVVFTPSLVLPVTFTSVKAYPQDKNISVKWSVENEMNIEQYEVEKSLNGTRFTTMAVEAATANGGRSANYLATDNDPTEGYNYYRVKSVDVNGKIAYSSVVKVQMSTVKQEIAIYPNPITDGAIHLQLINQQAGKYGVRLLNNSGQVVLVKQINHNEGSSTEIIKWDYNLAHGIYQLEVTKPGGTQASISIAY